ncbi:possible ABC transporter, ATP binding component [Synechococcus sp. RS9916]|nr:possible ABC transporter, ATP binding component [Synechococcus sp. RS9916]
MQDGHEALRNDRVQSLAAPSTPSALTPVVEMRDLTMQWGPRPVLDRVNLRMEPGERLAVVGPSGAGKSTVLRLLAGLQMPTSGALSLFGEPQQYLRLDQRHPQDVRLVFQNPALLASLTVEENVGFLLMRLGRFKPRQIRERVMACLEAVGLHDVADKYPGQLSGGMQKRVSFARALIDDPDRGEAAMPLMLYDEPTAGLDPVACTRIEDLIVKTTEVAKGCSVVVSHVHSTIERTAERVVLLYGGQLRWDGSIDDYRRTDNPYVQQFRTGNLHGPMQPNDH